MDAYRIAEITEKPLILRITFNSGGVVEERGTCDDVDALFAQDTDRLIDHIYGIDLLSQEVLIACHDDDKRWDDFDPGAALSPF
jgi:uncharacterized protein (UPF0371 family)